jgi:hypothetical protein
MTVSQSSSQRRQALRSKRSAARIKKSFAVLLKDLFSTLAVIVSVRLAIILLKLRLTRSPDVMDDCQATFLGGAEATILGLMFTASDKNHAWRASIILAYIVIVSSMFIAMLSALFGVFCTREKLLTPYKVASVSITVNHTFSHPVLSLP